MKYILFYIFSCFIFMNSVSADSWISSFSWTENPTDPTTTCPSTTSHGDTHHWIPNTNNDSVNPNGWPRSCTTHLYYSASDTLYPVSWRYNKEVIRNCPAGQRVVGFQRYNAWAPVAWAPWDQYTITCRNWDDSSPNVSYALAGGTTTNDTWVNADVTANINCNDTVWALDPWEGRSGCSGQQYRLESSSFTCNSSWIWTNGSSRTFAANGTYYICFRANDVAGNPYSYTSVATIKIDKTVPVAWDVQNILPINNQNLLASNAQNITFTINQNGGSPITSVRWYFENYTSPTWAYWTTAFTGSSWNFSRNFNIENVDLQRWVNGGRPYSMKITQICDGAGNCTTAWNDSTNAAGIVNLTYNVYANTLNLGTNTVQVNPFSSSIIADGSVKNLVVRLRDTYGNIIIPASGISRNVSMSIETDNFLRLNQYANNGNTLNDSAFFIDITSGTGRVWLGAGIMMSLWNRSSITWDFTIPMYVFAPTNTATSLVPGSLWINNLEFSTTGTLWPVSNVTIWNSNFSVTANPLFTTAIAGILNTQWFIEWVTQTGSQIIVTKANTTTTSPNNLYFEFWSYNTGTLLNEVNSRYDITLNGWGNVREWFMGGNPNSTAISWITLSGATYNLTSRMLLQSGAVNTATTSYLASIVRYQVWSPTKTVIYPADIIGKTAYHWLVGNNNTYQSGVKILGNTASKNVQEIVTDQFNGDVRILGNVEKSLARKDIQTSVYELIKNIDLPTSGTTTVSTTVLNSQNWNDTGLLAEAFNSNKILYFWTGVTLQTASNIEGIKTLVVEWNVYITGNIRDTDNDGMLGIIALSKNGQGGNIYIDPIVTDIHAVLYADKSVLSYDGSKEFDGSNSNAAELKNQLYIKGSIFSENTIGGSRKTPISCPFFVNTTCTSELAQKYDMNYLRRYFIYDSNINGSIEPTIDSPANGGSRSIGWGVGSWYEVYPVIIDYNTRIQQTPPPFFGK